MDKRKRRLLCMLEGSGQKSRWISGAPPLQYSAKKQGTLKNYRIYGNTVGGESVGDLVESGEHAGEYEVPVTVEGKNLFDEKYESIDDEYDLSNTIIYKSINVGAGVFTLSTNTPKTSEGYCNIFFAPGIVDSGVTTLINGVSVGNPKTFTSIDGYITIGYRYYHGVNPKLYQTQLERGNTATDYEPYHTPVTTPIYLPEPIKMVGDEAEYIDYAEQKQYFADGTETDVTLPALPTLTGANVLSVGTAVQPSEIEVKGKIKAL